MEIIVVQCVIEAAMELAYAEMSGQKSEVINSRFANQRIFPYIYP